MSYRYRILTKGGNGRWEDRKSVFISEIFSAKTENDAALRIAEIRKQYWDARHHCFAYICADAVKQSDDGEPSLTAGKPMMDILRANDLRNVCAVVTRYFGGVLLGTGGLVRAYQGAVKEALNKCSMAEVHDGAFYSCSIDYSQYSYFQHLTDSGDIYIIGTDFTDRISISFITDRENAGRLEKNISGYGNGRILLPEPEIRDFYHSGGQTVIV